MRIGPVLRTARQDAALTLRSLAENAGTSHSALAAYESSSKAPNTTTFVRIIEAAGFAADVELAPRRRGSSELPRGEELAQVLELAEQFPARHAATLEYPPFAEGAPAPR